MKAFIYLSVAIVAILTCQPAYAEVETLDPVVVTATRTSRSTSEVASSITVINSDQITASGATRLEEVLRDAVGLQLVANGPDGSLASASIRGSEANQVLVLLDGVRLNSTQNGQFDLSTLPIALEDIARIEVLRGPSAALYGSNALAGVIQIFTHAPSEKPLTRLSVMGGRFDNRKVSGMTTGKLERFRYRFSANREQGDGYRENSDYEQDSFNTLLGFDLGHGFDLELHGSYLDKEQGAPGPLSSSSLQARQWDKNSQASLTLSGPTGPLNWTLKGIYDRQRNEFNEPSGWFASHDIHLLKTYGSEIQVMTTKGAHSLLLGGDFYRDRMNSTANGKREQDRWSGFAQYELKPIDWVTLLFGVRYDSHSDFDSETSPRAAALLALSDSTQLRLSASKAFRAPTLNDRFWPASAWTAGNPNLTPETAWEYEIAVDQKITEKSDISVAVFRRDADDLIEWAETSPFFWTPSNVSKARIWGVEFEGNWQIHRLLRTGADYTYLHPKNETTDQFIVGKARHQAHLFIGVGPIKEARLRLDGRYLCYYPEATRTDKSHIVLDASLTRPFVVNDNFEIQLELSVKNLLDEDYQESVGYPMPPRQVFLGLSSYF